MSSKKSTLSDKLAELANPTPVLTTPDEDDVNPETSAKVVDWEEEEEDGDITDVSATRSQLRTKNAALLEAVDRKYAGKCVSRKTLRLQRGDLESETDGETASEDVEEDDEDPEVEKKEFDDEDDVSKGEGDSEDESEGEFLDNFKGEKQRVEPEDDESEEEEMQMISATDINEEVLKGQATKCQLGICDGLLEMRISLQKVLGISNKLPQHDKLRAFQKKGDEEFQSTLQSSQSSVKNLCDKLLELQVLLMHQYPETKQLGKETPQKEEASDEEIPSDSDDELKEPVLETETKAVLPKKKMKLEEYENYISQSHSTFLPFRNSTIQKWNEKTRVTHGKISSKNFSAFEQSTLKQIDQILSDKDRLIRRTQLKRSAYRVLGKTDEAANKKKDDQETPHLNDYDVEIFDDDDFYHQLLRELIERNTSNVSDPTQLGRKLLKLEKFRSKLKRAVDTKASKGRKIRYNSHPKLVNFMAPVTSCQMADAATTELFNSLFGGRRQEVAK